MAHCDNCPEMIALLAAWDTLVTKTNSATTQEEIDAAYKDFDAKVQGIAVANGHPPGKPQRKL